MEDEIYEFNPMNRYKKNITKRFLNREIGTYFEVEDDEEGMFIITVFELTPHEVNVIRDFETENL